jgi:hypothetical protein
MASDYRNPYEPWEGAYMSDEEFDQFLDDHVRDMQRLRRELEELTSQKNHKPERRARIKRALSRA